MLVYNNTDFILAAFYTLVIVLLLVVKV